MCSKKYTILFVNGRCRLEIGTIYKVITFIKTAICKSFYFLCNYFKIEHVVKKKITYFFMQIDLSRLTYTSGLQYKQKCFKKEVGVL